MNEHYNLCMQPECIWNIEQLISEKKKLSDFYSNANDYYKIDDAFIAISYLFNAYDEDKKRRLCCVVKNLRKGLRLIFQADEELDIMKLAEGNNLIKTFLSFSRKL
jgi:hypothetical protein